MKTVALILLCVFYAECRKTYAPIDKNANLAFINMEGGGGVRPGANANPAAQAPPQTAPKPAAPKPVQPTPATSKPAQPAPATIKPVQPAPQPITIKPVITPAPPPAKPQSHQTQPKPVNPATPPKPVTTPGPGSVKQLINFYDSQGKASQIRPYSYSQSVKQG